MNNKMDEFSVPVEPIFRACTVNANNSSNSNNNNNNNSNGNMHQLHHPHPLQRHHTLPTHHTQHHHHHHHKDHMLAAGSTPSTTAFLYETPQNAKPDMTMAKSDYTTFTSCIQHQATLLDPRSDTNIDANLDAAESMASLSGLCDLKFTNTANLMNSTAGGDGTSPSSGVDHLHADTNNFKNLPLLPIIEANNLLVSGGDGSRPGSGSTGSADNLIKTVDICDNIVAQIAKFSQLKSESDDEREFLKEDNYVASIKQEILTSTAPTTTFMGGGTANNITTSNCCTQIATPAAQMADNTQLMGFHLGVQSSSTTTDNNSTALMNAMKSPINTTTNRILSAAVNATSITTTTTTPITTKITSITTNIGAIVTSVTTASNNNGNIIAITSASQLQPAANGINSQQFLQQHNQRQQQQQQLQQQQSSGNVASNFHSIEELGAHTNTTRMYGGQVSSNMCSNKANIFPNTISPAATNSHTTTTTTTLSSSTTSVTTRNCRGEQWKRQQSQNTDNSVNDENSDSNEASSSGDEHLGSDFNDTISEFMPEDEPLGTGYQDTTSSHSQHSSNNGGGGGGGGQTNLAIPNSAAGPGGVSLINGVVTLNSQISGNGSSGGPPGSGGGGGGIINSSNNGPTSYMSLLPPAVGATSSSGPHLTAVNALGGTSALTTATTADVIDIKQLFEELCPVCGDKVSGYHYGLLTCESCKGFFKRTVQNKKVYTCVAERSCHIDKTQRKRCPYCRFQKCLDVGMKLEAVRADRMRGGRNKFGPMYKRDRARKLQVMRQRQIALQALRTMSTNDMKSTPLSPAGYQQAYTNMNIKQEIQIPQVSSLTQSPDSSPSPIAIALGQVPSTGGVIATPLNGNSGTAPGAGSSGGGGGSSSGGGGISGGGGGSGGGGIGSNGNLNNPNNNHNSDGLNRVANTGSSNSCHDSGTGSLQNASDSKLCFDSGTHPSSTADSIIEPPLRVSPMIREFVQSIDDREWQTQLFALLQKQTYNQVEVDLFELMCKVLDQNLFSQVDWARNTVFFKDLKVDDQMKLLQHSWSDMLVLDHLHQRIHNGLPDETQLNNGQIFNLLNLGLLGVTALADYFNEIQNKLQDLKFDMGDYVCMKFLILLNPDVHGIINKKAVLRGYQNVQGALLDYNLTCYQSVTDKFQKLLNILPEIHALAARGEEHLYTKHCAGSAPTQTLLMEMLHAKRKV